MTSWSPALDNTEATSVQRRRRAIFLVLAVLLAVVHFGFLVAFFAPAISTPDANGYFAQARLIANEQRTWFATESILQYVPPHWHKTGEDRYFSKYPPGLPAIAAVVLRLFGPEAALLVNPIMASLSLLGLFLICRLWIGGGWGLLAAALMAVNPFANQQALWAFAHTAVAFFLIWGVFFLARWAKTHSPGCAFGAGLCLGVIPTLRYAEALFGLGFVVFVLLNLRRNRGAWRSLVAGGLGVVVPLGALCVRNHQAFGAFWKTGYDLANKQLYFGWTYFTSYSVQYLQQLLSDGCGLLFGLGIVGIAVLCARRDTWKRGVLLAVLIVPSTLLYMSYYWAPDRQSMRFLVPTFFIYPIASTWLLRVCAGTRRAPAWAGSATLLFVTICWGLPPSIGPLQRLEHTNAALAQVTRTLKEHVAPGSIVIADGLFQQHLDYIGDWRLADQSVMTYPGGRRPEAHFADEDAPDPRRPRRMEKRFHRYADLRGPELFDAFSEDIWQWAGEHRKVYWIGDEEQLDLFEEQLWPGDKLTTVAKIELPQGEASVFHAPGGFGPPMAPDGGPDRGPRPHRRFGRLRDRPPPGAGMNRRFDVLQTKEPLLLVEWTRGALSIRRR